MTTRTIEARDAWQGAAVLGAADWLYLAAAPTFAVMALLAAGHGGDPQDMLCMAAPHGLSVGGMAPMYALMSAFHTAPWLRLIARRRRVARRV